MNSTPNAAPRCPISTVNFHLWKPCNMKCAHCFAHFDDAGHANLPREDAVRVVSELGLGFERITFVGGEPTLCPWLLDLFTAARECGMSVGLVTNAWRMCREPAYARRILEDLDWLGLSVDSFCTESNLRIGRSVRRQTLVFEDLLSIATAARSAGVRLKVNTVVQRANVEEDMLAGISALRPDRWKILQVLPVLGQNEREYGDCAVSNDEFRSFVERHRGIERQGINLVPEDHVAMTESYAMVDPGGYAFDNAEGRYRYSSKPVQEIGWQRAFAEVRLDVDRFLARDGRHARQGGLT